VNAILPYVIQRSFENAADFRPFRIQDTFLAPEGTLQTVAHLVQLPRAPPFVASVILRTEVEHASIPTR